MARHYTWMLVAIVIAVVGSPALARPQKVAEPQRPPQQTQQARDGGRDGSHERRLWWKDPRDVAEIGLTAEQSETIDQIFRTELAKILALRRVVNDLERALDETMRANTADIDAFARQVNKIEGKRAELNSMRTVMLYRMRRVLKADQNAKFQAMADRREAARKKQDNDRRR
ncbi:MAG TPA: periplasmic heavy metal sensor [Vicinamibacterales bacterium]|nr:periplasmic heavy metal sensor [Vicinamibacterales bacterium]